MGRGYGQKRYLECAISLIERNDPSTTNVVLNGFGISDAKLAVLAMALVSNTHVRRVHLDGNRITDRGASLLAYTLQKNATLELLSLCDNEIRSAGMEAVAAALRKNRGLRTLRLANNSIGNHGGRRLQKTMCRNRILREVFLEGNRIDARVAGEFDGRLMDKGKMTGESAADAPRGKASSRRRISAADSTTESHYGSYTDVTAATEPTALTDASPWSGESEAATSSSSSEEEDEARLEWAASSALTLFGGASFYMENAAARKYIIGDEEEDEDDDGECADGNGNVPDCDSSWTDLGTYMASLQSAIDRSEREEAEAEARAPEDAPRLSRRYNDSGYDPRTPINSTTDVEYEPDPDSDDDLGIACCYDGSTPGHCASYRASIMTYEDDDDLSYLAEEDDLSVLSDALSDVVEELSALEMRKPVETTNKDRGHKVTQDRGHKVTQDRGHKVKGGIQDRGHKGTQDRGHKVKGGIQDRGNKVKGGIRNAFRRGIQKFRTK